MTPQEEQIDPATLEADQSRMSELLTKVSADGHDVLDEAPAPAEQVETEPEVVELETPPADPAAPPQEPPTEPVAAQEDTPQDDYEREIDTNEKYQLSKNASQRSKEVNGILKRINKEKHRETKALRKEIQDWQSKKLLDDQTEKELQELRDLRSRVAIEQDPQFNEQYVQKIQKHEGHAMSILQHHALPEETAKFIGENGGLIRFQNSDRRMPVGTQDLEGNPFTGTQAEWYKDVMEPMFKSLPTAAQTRLKYELEEALKTAIQRDDALQEARGNPQKFVEQRQQDFQKQVEAFAKEADAEAERQTDIYGDLAKPKEIPDKATAEQKAEILAHNARIEEAKETIKKGFTDQTPRHRMQAEMALAFRDHFVEKELPRLQKALSDKTKQYDELQSKWDKAKSSAQTSRQQSTVAQQKPREETKPYDAAESIKGLMEQVPA